MTYGEIYNLALAYLNESATADCADYEDRAGYILASALSYCAPADKKYRQANGLEALKLAKLPAYVELESECPLSDVFVAPIAYYLAAMLCLDENEALSEGLFDRYTDAIATLMCSLPTATEKISDHYSIL